MGKKTPAFSDWNGAASVEKLGRVFGAKSDVEVWRKATSGAGIVRLSIAHPRGC
jgi:hypothetical protein